MSEPNNEGLPKELSEKSGNLEEGVGASLENCFKNPDDLCPKRVWADDDFHYIRDMLLSAYEPIGLDIHPFLVGWYNEKVGPRFHLEYPDDTLCFVVIGGPHMFEKCIIPYVRARLLECPEFTSTNLLEDSMKHAFTIVQSDLELEGFETDIFYDFDMHVSRKPKVLVQTAAHVAGAVQYLHKDNLPPNIREERFSKKSNLNGVAIHPKYGGWYAIRGVLIFRNVQILENVQSVQRPDPVSIFTEPEEIVHVLELFAYHWQTNEWRNIHQGLGLKYSNAFLTYLNTESDKRWEFVKSCAIEVDDDDSSDLLSSTEIIEPKHA